MSHHDNDTSNTKLFAEKTKGVRMAMMTTVESDGTLRSRPMATLGDDFDGDLWFFTRISAPKVEQAQQHDQVNISYSKPDDNLYVSASGSAELVRDKKKMKELWSPMVKLWFPDGLEDPDLGLLKVHVESAEFWDSPSGKMSLLYRFAKGRATKNPDVMGEDVKLDMK